MEFDYYMVRTLSPCKDCQERHAACHDNCERYKEYRKQLTKYRNEEREQKRWEKIINEKPIKHKRRTS